MARYNLILRDETWITLYKKAASLGLSFGKYVNQILNKAAISEIKTDIPLCYVCGKTPVWIEYYQKHILYSWKYV